jgi:hypothetical protein
MARSAAGSPGLALWLGLAALVIVADQVTKTLILGLPARRQRPVTVFFNLVRVHNTGAAFSFLAGASGWQRWFFVGWAWRRLGVHRVDAARHPTQKLFCFAVTMMHGRRRRQRHRPPAARLRGRLPAVPLRLLAPLFPAATSRASTSPTAPSRSARSA